jgi:LmbE family N-acetylglucosaminyl deacetylase
MTIFHHPDDESLGLGGTLTKYSVENVETFLICNNDVNAVG